jgi:Kef-type K+ transport system membrane component KefB
VRQVVILAALLLLTGLSAALGRQIHGVVTSDAETVTATGFVLLAAYALGELMRRFRLPALLGYLAAGLAFGPSLAEVVLGSRALAPITDTSLRGLTLVNMLAVGVIGTLGGGEIRVDELKASFGKIAAISLATFAIVLPVVPLVVLGMTRFAPGLVPFLADEPWVVQLAAALLFGTLAVGMSPSATLALLLEVRAHGTFTSLVLGVVVFADIVLVATFLVVLALAKLVVSPTGLSVAGMLEVLPHIAGEFGWAIVLGLVVGVVFIGYLRLVGRELLLFSLGTIFLTSFVASRLHAETLLAFLVGGFVVQNFSRHGHTLVEAFERIALPVFVIYFATQAAQLDLVAVTVYLPLTLVIVGSRCGLFFYGISAACKAAGVDEAQRRLLRISFLSQGGVDLVLAAMIAQAIPGWGVHVQTVTVATILFYVVLGPPLLARALDRAGESEAARERGTEQLATRRDRDETPPRRATLAAVATGDPALDRTLDRLREVLRDALRQMVRTQAVARATARREVVSDVLRRTTAALDPAGAQGDGDGSVDLACLRARWEAVHEVVCQVTGSGPATAHPVDSEGVEALLAHLADAEPLNSQHRIARQPRLFEPGGALWLRLLRRGRRIRRAVLGPGVRTVAVGRLWRYHVALDAPVALWAAVRAEEGEIWSALLRHHRAAWAVQPTVARDAESAASPRDALTVAHGELLAQCDAWLAAWREQDRALEYRLEAAFEDIWTAFSAAVEVAGTLEYPAWRYRISARHDAAQAAIAELRERLDRDRQVVEGARDAMATLAHTARVSDHLSRDVERLSLSLLQEVESNDAGFGRARELGESLGAAATRAQVAEVAGTLLSTVAELSRDLEGVARRLAEPHAPALLGLGLPGVLPTVPAGVRPLALPTGAVAQETGERRTSIALRSWFERRVVRELTVAVLDVRAQAATRVGEVVVALEHVRQVVDYHAVTAAGAGPGPQLDAGVGARVASLVAGAQADLSAAAADVGRQLGAQQQRLHARGIAPLLDGRWKDVQRQERRFAGEAAVGPAWVDRVRSGVARELLALLRLGARLRDELAAVFVERATPAAMLAYRGMLFGPPSAMNEAYQRLFTSAPAESLGLVVERPQITQLVVAIEDWLRGAGGPILVHGDRGGGRRTIVREAVSRLHARVSPRWVLLSPDLDREAAVCAELGTACGLPRVSSFEALAAALHWGPRRGADAAPAIVLTNVERLFRRTPEGLDQVRRFFELVTATKDEVLWIVISTEAAVRCLGPLADLEARFSSVVAATPMTADELATVLMMRHRLSGYPLRFRHHRPSLHEWVRSPPAAWRTRRQTGGATYERLAQLSAGNVRQALRLWLVSAHLDPSSGEAIVGPLEATGDPLLESLPLTSRLLLAALLLHGPLRRDDLGEVLPGERSLDAEIGRLSQLRFVTVRSDVTPPVRSALLAVSTRLVAPLTKELRACNLL